MLCEFVTEVWMKSSIQFTNSFPNASPVKFSPVFAGPDLSHMFVSWFVIGQCGSYIYSSYNTCITSVSSIVARA